MSIVLEALEKAQREGIKEEKREVLPQKEFSKNIPKPKKEIRKHNMYFWIGILCVAILNLWLLNWWLNNNEAVVSVNVSTPVTLPEHAVSPKPQTREIFSISYKNDVIPKTENPVLMVSGIVWDPEEPIALINGKFFRKGDEVLGAKIEEIQVDRVKFLYKDEEFTIPVQR